MSKLTRRPSLLLNSFYAAILVTTAISPALSQTQPQKLESCKPVSERTSPEGCWIIASTPLGKLPATPIYWTLDTYPTKEAAQASATKNSTVVQALDNAWLLTVGDKSSPSPNATRVAEIGPLLIHAGEEYTAQYRESIMQPGAVSRTHLHSGPEAFYTQSGQTCLETPAGMQTGSKGSDLIAPEGIPMELTATGAELRRGIVLVLHATARPHTTVVTDWVSKGLCKSKP